VGGCAVERLDEGGKVVHMVAPDGLPGRPAAEAVAATVVADDRERLGQGGRDHLPVAVVGPAAVHEHERRAVALHLVVERPVPFT
jgi:hypothetical protein